MITKEEKETLKNFGETNDLIEGIEQETDFGIKFALPGHDLYIFNEGSGWMYQLQSDFIQYPDEGEDFDTVEDAIEALPF